MLVRKTYPIGIDKIVDAIQVKLDESTFFSGTDWDNFPRAYKNPKHVRTNGYMPEVYDGNGEYKEVLMNDKMTLTSFFVAGDQRPYSNTNMTSDLSLIVQCSDLDEIFPSIEHRADEELIHKFLNILNVVPGIKITNIETSISEVYKEFDIRDLIFDDMGSFFVFRVNMSTSFGLACCNDC